MSCRMRSVMAAFAALVAGTIFIVYAYRDDLAEPSAAGAADQPAAATETAKPKSAAPTPTAEPPAPAAMPAQADRARGAEGRGDP